MNPSPVEEILIIGAGTSGLALAHELINRGLRPRILESASRSGARWRTRHPQLRLNTHRMLSHLPGRHIPGKAGAFPSRSDFVSYIEDYERALGIDIDYGVRANRIARDSDLWRVETSADSILTRDLAVATGPDNIPFAPQWPGMNTFPGRIIHSGEFGRVEDYVGKRILLVGAGNSSVDIANHLARASTRQIWMSVRGSSTVAPQYILGAPTHLLTPLMRPLPVPAVDMIVRLLSRWNCGDLTKFGMPAPRMGALSRMLDDGTAPAIDNGFADAVKSGKILLTPAIDRFDDGTVYLNDGEAITPDVVICGTGYSTGLKALVTDLDVLDDQGNPRFAADEGSPVCPGLWFFGFRNSFWGNLNERRHEARRLARRIVARSRQSPDSQFTNA